MSNFEKLSLVSDNMLIFCAGFLLEASRRFHIVLAGGTQMASCLLVADKLREDVLMRIKSENISIATTSWVANDENSDLKHILSLLSYTPHAVHTSFSFANAEIPVLKLYDEGEAKEGVGAGAALAYANTNGAKLDIIDKSGAWFSYEETKLGQGRENVKIKFKEEPELANEIEEKIKVAMGVSNVMIMDTSDIEDTDT